MCPSESVFNNPMLVICDHLLLLTINCALSLSIFMKCFSMTLTLTDQLKEELVDGNNSELLPFTEESLIYKWVVHNNDGQVVKEVKYQQQHHHQPQRQSSFTFSHQRADSTEEEQDLLSETVLDSSFLQPPPEGTVWQDIANTSHSPNNSSAIFTFHASPLVSTATTTTIAPISSSQEMVVLAAGGGAATTTASISTTLTPGKLLWPSLIRTQKQLLEIQKVSSKHDLVGT